MEKRAMENSVLSLSLHERQCSVQFVTYSQILSSQASLLLSDYLFKREEKERKFISE